LLGVYSLDLHVSVSKTLHQDNDILINIPERTNSGTFTLGIILYKIHETNFMNEKYCLILLL
jgi:hypothetical protein